MRRSSKKPSSKCESNANKKERGHDFTPNHHQCRITIACAHMGAIEAVWRTGKRADLTLMEKPA
jgi:hypothetical protein